MLFRSNFASRNYNVINAPPANTYSLSSLAASYNEGDTITITITTVFIVDGTVLYWTTSGTSTGADFSDGVTSGSVTITNNTGTVTRTLLSDLVTEGTETFVFELRTGSTSGPIVATTSSANILDTSISPKDYSVSFTAASSQYLSVPASSAFQMTGDFTMECWAYFTSFSNYVTIFDQYVSSATGAGNFTIQPTTSGVLAFYYDGSNVLNAGTLSTNIWYHLAFTRSGSTIRVFINGVQTGTVTFSGTVGRSDTTFWIGSEHSGGPAYYMAGYLSNVRIVKGTALYTAAFSPPTSTLTAIANTSLLTCLGGTIADGSTNAFTITNNGSALVSGEHPFGNYSMSFNGSSQYLTVPSNAAFAFGTGDFTVEAWIYTTAISSTTQQAVVNAGGSGGFIFTVYSNKIHLAQAGVADLADFTTTLANNTWYHIAIVRSLGSTKAYVNGVQQGSSYTDSTSYTASGITAIGAQYDATIKFTGYISNVRVVKGTAVYTTNFTPSTSPLTSITNTSLLTAQYAEFFDASTNHFTITNNGSTPAITANPFDNYAYAFNGSSQYLTVASNTALGFGTGDFTVEFWVYPTANTRQDWFDLSDGVSRLLIYHNNNAIRYYNGSGSNVADRIIGAAMTPNSWQHIAVSRVSGNSRLFINGSQSGSTYADSGNHATLPLTIGKDSAPGGTTYSTGYMSNIRVVKGTGLYSANSTISTAPLTAVANTSLLTAQYAELFDASSNHLTVTNNGAAPAVATNLFAGQNGLKNYSGKFNGSNQWVEIVANHNIFAATSENFTIEAWVYMTSLPTHSMVCGWNKSGYDYFEITPTSAGLNMNNTYNTVMSFSFATNTWYHVAFSRTSNIVKGFVNGNLLFTGSSDSAQFGDGTVTFGVGRWYTTPNYYFPGYISNFRFIKGTGLYTSTFTPSATPLLPVANTTLLTLQTNRIYDSGPKQYTITNNGSTTMAYLSPFAT